MFWIMQICLSLLCSLIFRFQTVIHSKAEANILMFQCKSPAFYFLFSEQRPDLQLWAFVNRDVLP